MQELLPSLQPQAGGQAVEQAGLRQPGGSPHHRMLAMPWLSKVSASLWVRSHSSCSATGEGA